MTIEDKSSVRLWISACKTDKLKFSYLCTMFSNVKRGHHSILQYQSLHTPPIIIIQIQVFQVGLETSSIIIMRLKMVRYLLLLIFMECVLIAWEIFLLTDSIREII